MGVDDEDAASNADEDSENPYHELLAARLAFFNKHGYWPDAMADLQGISKADQGDDGLSGSLSSSLNDMTVDEEDNDKPQNKEEEESLAAMLGVSTSTMKSIQEQNDVQLDMILLHQEIKNMPDPATLEGLSDKERLVQEIRFRHHCGRKTTHQCLVLIGEFKRNIGRLAELKLLRNDRKTNGEKARELDERIDRYVRLSFLRCSPLSSEPSRLEQARLDLAQYCFYYFKCYPLITEVVAFAAAGPYWQYALVKKEDVPQFDEDVRQWEPDSLLTLNSLICKFSPYTEIGTSDSDSALTKMRDDHLHSLAYNHLLVAQ